MGSSYGYIVACAHLGTGFRLQCFRPSMYSSLVASLADCFSLIPPFYKVVWKEVLMWHTLVPPVHLSVRTHCDDANRLLCHAAGSATTVSGHRVMVVLVAPGHCLGRTPRWAVGRGAPSPVTVVPGPLWCQLLPHETNVHESVLVSKSDDGDCELEVSGSTHLGGVVWARCLRLRFLRFLGGAGRGSQRGRGSRHCYLGCQLRQSVGVFLALEIHPPLPVFLHGIH